MRFPGCWLGVLCGAAGLTAQTMPEEPVMTLERFNVSDRITDPSVAIGNDLPRSQISITREALLAAPAGISGLKMLESLPGFNVQTNDALGLYEFGNTVFVRAFGFQQIGFVLDGIPLGRPDAFGGSPIFRYVDNENLGRIEASTGTGDVSSPSYSSLGPSVYYSTLVPSSQFGASADLTLGSDNLTRTFVKVQTGEHGGFSGYLSRSKIDSDLWRGPGTIDREHIEAKLRYVLAPGKELSLLMVYNDFFDYDSPSINKAQYYGTANDAFGRSGRFFSYLGSIPDLPPLSSAPGVPYSNTLLTQTYYTAINQRTDHLYGLTGRFDLGTDWSLDATIYYEDKDGYGVSPDSYANSLSWYNTQRNAGVAGLFAPKGVQYGLSTVGGERTGGTAALSWQGDRHAAKVGIWIESEDYYRTQARFNMEEGSPAGTPLLDEPVFLWRDYKSVRDTLQLFAKDSIDFGSGRTKLEFGVKALAVDYAIAGYRDRPDYLAGAPTARDATFEDWFLPLVGVVHEVSDRSQLFASYGENYALPRGADDIFSLGSVSVPAPEAEEATNLEVGYRANLGSLYGSMTLYYTTFDNRLQSFAAEVPGTGGRTETYWQNVGAVDAYGVEFTGGWRPKRLDNFALTTNVTYNVAEFQDDFPGFPIAGNRVPDNGEWIVQSAVTYEPTGWAVLGISAKYLSDRYTNFGNTEMVGGYTTYAAYLDLGGDKLANGVLKHFKMRLNVDNLTDKDYFGTINVTTGASASFRPLPARTYQLTLSATW